MCLKTKYFKVISNSINSIELSPSWEARRTSHFIELEYPLHSLQYPITYPYPESDESSPPFLILLCKMELNFISPSLSRYSKWSLSLMFPEQILGAFLMSAARAIRLASLVTLDLIIHMISGVERRSSFSSSCHFLHPSLTSSLSGLRMFPSTPIPRCPQHMLFP